MSYETDNNLGLDAIVEELINIRDVLDEKQKEQEFSEIPIGEHKFRLLLKLEKSFRDSSYYDENQATFISYSEYQNLEANSLAYVFKRKISVNLIVLELPNFLSKIFGRFWIFKQIDIDVIDWDDEGFSFKEARCLFDHYNAETMGIQGQETFYHIAVKEFDSLVERANKEDRKLVQEMPEVLKELKEDANN